MRNSYIIYLVIIFAFISAFNTSTAQDRKERILFEPGTIVCSQTARAVDERHRASNITYDPYIIGVATAEENKLSIYDLIQTDGVALVKYNLENGPIKKGDFVTSSSSQGVAMKATSSGMVLGVALEDGNKKDGFLKIRILIHYKD